MKRITPFSDPDGQNYEGLTEAITELDKKIEAVRGGVMLRYLGVGKNRLQKTVNDLERIVYQINASKTISAEEKLGLLESISAKSTGLFQKIQGMGLSEQEKGTFLQKEENISVFISVFQKKYSPSTGENINRNAFIPPNQEEIPLFTSAEEALSVPLQENVQVKPKGKTRKKNHKILPSVIEENGRTSPAQYTAASSSESRTERVSRVEGRITGAPLREKNFLTEPRFSTTLRIRNEGELSLQGEYKKVVRSGIETEKSERTGAFARAFTIVGNPNKIARISCDDYEALREEVEVFSVLKDCEHVVIPDQICFLEDTHLVCIMDKAENDLYRWIRSSKRSRRPSELAGYVLQTVIALREIHEKRILHRDVKLENFLVFLDPKGKARIRLSDFGMAKRLSEKGFVTGYSGTEMMMSPEALSGEKQSFRSDVYSLALMIDEVFSGEILADPTGKAWGTCRRVREDVRIAPDRYQNTIRDVSAREDLAKILQEALYREPSRRISATQLEARFRQWMKSL